METGPPLSINNRFFCRPIIGRKACILAICAVFLLAISDPFDVQSTSANHLLFDEGRSFDGLEDSAPCRLLLRLPS
jgi:hypothetical protein